jgi:hypothetical protein
MTGQPLPGPAQWAPRRGQNPCLGHISGYTGSLNPFEKSFLHSKCDRPIDWRRSRGPTRPLGTPLGPRKCRGRAPGGRPGRAGSGTIFGVKPKIFQKILGGPKTLFKGSQTCLGP